jgi:hypothetical protein
LTSKLINN